MTLDAYRPEFEKVAVHLLQELGSIRTGRATPALVDGVLVEAYASHMPIQQLATITTADARTLLVDPWDKAVLKEIEKAIRLAQPSLNPVSDGKILRIPMPQLTEDARRDLTKLIGQKVEQAKQSTRKIRDDARSAILEAERTKQVTEDDRYRLQKKLDELTEEYTMKFKTVGEKKVEEIMTV
ncbi:ribosome recycling factor [Candidatus Uhrbacteria bacterium]|nr:ribosome recycling factor [Candidatus Uhrbacteria bacterium]